MNIIYSRIKLLINIEWAWSQIFEFSTESSNKKVQYAICKATALKYKTRRRYKTQRLPTVDCRTTSWQSAPQFMRTPYYHKNVEWSAFYRADLK